MRIKAFGIANLFFGVLAIPYSVLSIMGIVRGLTKGAEIIVPLALAGGSVLLIVSGVMFLRNSKYAIRFSIGALLTVIVPPIVTQISMVLANPSSYPLAKVISPLIFLLPVAGYGAPNPFFLIFYLALQITLLRRSAAPALPKS